MGCIRIITASRAEDASRGLFSKSPPLFSRLVAFGKRGQSVSSLSRYRHVPYRHARSTTATNDQLGLPRPTMIASRCESSRKIEG